MLAEMGMSSIPSILPIPKVHAAFDDADVPKEEALRKRTDKFVTELEWYACALKVARDKPRERSECEAQQVGPAG